VVDGHIVWVVDGYTTSPNYPYSATVSLSQAIADSNNPAPRYTLDNINYIRNSVKATVDAYSGKVTLYSWDSQDPLLKAWQKVYPSTIKPMTDMSGELMSHVRYPTDLFKVQRAILGTYHVTSAQSFYQQDNLWTTPNDPQKPDRLQPPYYLTMQMPTQPSPEFSMFSTFIPKSNGGETARNVLLGYLAVDSNAGNQAGEKRSDYGRLRMLEIDAASTVPGPGQVQNMFDSQPSVSQFLNLLKQGQSEVLNGNLLTLPLGGGLIYVQPVFVQSSGETKLPKLQKVLVAFGNNVAFEDTLDQALNALFGGNSGAAAGDSNTTPTPNPLPSASASGTPGTGGSGGGTSNSAEYQAWLKAAQQAMLDRDAAMKAGDWTAYGTADKALTDAVQHLIALGGP
jgi:hypothetical protein